MKTQIKKLLSILTLIAILATAIYTVPVNVSAKEYIGNDGYLSSDGDWVYIFLTNKEIMLVEYRGNETEVTVPETVDKYKVVGIGNTNDDDYGYDSTLNPDYKFFGKDTNITKVTLPKTIQKIGCNYYYSHGSDWDGWDEGEYFEEHGICYSNLDSNKSVVEFSIDKENPYFTSEDGVIYNKDKTKLIMYPAGKTDEVFTIPETVTEVADFAFANTQVKRIENFDNITDISHGLFIYSNIEEIPQTNKIDLIRSYAFAYCNNLKKITIPATINKLLDHAFYSCKNANEIDFGKITYIEYAAFAQCSALKEAVLPITCDVIGRFAFSNCKNLEKISISKVNAIDYRAFYKCRNLTTIHYNKNQADYYDEDFYLDDVLKNEIHADVIAYQAFMGCTSLKKIDVLDAETIGYGAFLDCTALEKVSFSDDLPESIDDDSFVNTALVNNHKDGVVYIDDIALCYKEPEKPATSIKIKSGTKHIAADCLYDIPSVKSIYLPSSLETVEDGNFGYYGNHLLDRVYITGLKTEFKGRVDGGCTYYILPKAYKVLDYFDNGDYIYTTNWNPDKTKSVKAVGKTKSTAKITWKKQGYVSGYEVFMKTSKNGSWKKVATLKGSRIVAMSFCEPRS